MHRISYLVALGTLIGTAMTNPAYAVDTAGSAIQPINFQQNNLTAIEWTSTMEEYEGQEGADFLLRIDFQYIEMEGASGGRALTTAIQNVYHTFEDDEVIIPPPSPGLNLYWSSLLPGLADGVALDADPTAIPFFGRVFENVDAIGNIGNNIYNRATLGTPSSTTPIEVQWSITRIGIETAPPGQLTRGQNGMWLPLIGTFAVWKCEAVIDGVFWDIATYYLPVEYCEFINAGTPISLNQEHFENNGGGLDQRRTKVRYSDFRVWDGVDWFPLLEWVIYRRIDDERGNNDNRFGWYADGEGLYSVCGDPSYETTAHRDPGQLFLLGDAASCMSPSIPASCDPDCNGNAIGDVCDITATTSGDCNLNGMPDECEGDGFAFLELGDAFCIIPGVNGLQYENYADNRTGGIPGPGNERASPLAFAGTLNLGAGSAEYLGPTYHDSAYFYPYVQHEVARGFVWVHPGNAGPSGPTGAGAAISFVAPTAGTYHIVGDFARANDFQFAGDGVDVAVFTEFNADTPLFGANISSVNTLDPNDPFSGTGVAHFDLSTGLSGGEILRFAVFPGPPGDLDIGFDATALRFSIWSNNDIDGNGTPDECEANAPLAAASPHDIRKNRFISIDPNNDEPVALTVQLLDLACSLTAKKCDSASDCKACVGGGNNGLGCSIGSDCPNGTCELSGETCLEQSPPVMLGWVGDPFEAGGDATPGTITSMVVKTQPAARIWTEPVVHIGDCEIAPAETYAISVTTDGALFSAPLIIGTIEKPQGKFWGDVVGSFNGASWSAPNVLVNVDDVVATINFLTLKPAPHVTVIDIVGDAPSFVNFDVNATDLLVVLQAFGGQEYPPPSFVAEGYPADGDVTKCP